MEELFFLPVHCLENYLGLQDIPDPSEAADAAINENFDPNYLLFEETSRMEAAGQVPVVYVPVPFNSGKTDPNLVSRGFVEVMCRVSRIRNYEVVPVDEKEPIRFNTAVQVRDYLRDKSIRSIIVVTPVFCSRRSLLIYRSVFASSGIKVSCLPVYGGRNPSNWTESWHGIQEVFLEFGKLWYYRLVVL